MLEQVAAADMRESASIISNGATYQVVDTGQETCYNSIGQESTCPVAGATLYGQDAQFDGNQPSYTNNNDGTISDNVTDLMWQQSPDTDGDNDIDSADKKIEHAKSKTSQYLTMSVGLSCQVIGNLSSSRELLGRVDQALKTAKAKGRNRMVILDT